MKTRAPGGRREDVGLGRCRRPRGSPTISKGRGGDLGRDEERRQGVGLEALAARLYSSLGCAQRNNGMNG
ncbi:unnamed protein product [Linum trigynum]|uniref:Uncharacterized protein n=1 Tax=Linum trigynum TaxID=586398 RepID=A0AAV2FQM7_9ROSI